MRLAFGSSQAKSAEVMTSQITPRMFSLWSLSPSGRWRIARTSLAFSSGHDVPGQEINAGHRTVGSLRQVLAEREVGVEDFLVGGGRRW